ncbi:unnamed protein product [[Candida] boidinii]|uniref:Unnamed protein product n=1 Tax=Candida boidinii TaxID=5477 RepID=A0A9W6WGD7_CANBO|nr:hypothetical protein B5S30_g1643 [[Candida] boidinii]OWB83764.1 hypothetical protein B5S33_g2397 [[Candida] boidinii]GME69310.1 unnamed protein product [[Candida] boidinii]
MTISDPQNFELELTLSPKIYSYCQSRNYETWGIGLTNEQYLEREVVSYQGPMCNASRDFLKDREGVLYWVLRDKTIVKKDADDEDTYNIVCACETLGRKSIVYDPNGNEGKGQIHQDILSTVIGSVYTFPEFRKRGYASNMFVLLIKKMEEYLYGANSSNLNFSYLYSEVGEYYSRFGYKSFHIPLFEFKVPEPTTTTTETLIPIDKVNNYLDHSEILKFGEFEELMETYKNKFETAFKESVKGNKDKYIVATYPNARINDWFHRRGIHTYFCRNSQDGDSNEAKIRELSKELVFGLKLKSNPDNFLVYHQDVASNELVILLVNSDSNENYVKLIQDTIKLSSISDKINKHKIKKVKVWITELITDFSDRLSFKQRLEDFEAFKEDEINLKLGERKQLIDLYNSLKSEDSIEFELLGNIESLSAIRFLDDELNEQTIKDDSLIWSFNSKWTWY